MYRLSEGDIIATEAHTAMSTQPAHHDDSPTQTYLRIGELARRAGVTPELLRAWERRYGLLHPQRTAGGFRLYGDDDLARITAMRAGLDQGLSAAEAARHVLENPKALGPEPVPAEAITRLRTALDGFDDAGAQAALDRLLATLSLEAVISEVMLPTLRDLGERWARGEVTVAQEHFVSALLRGRLLALGRGWDRGVGPLALLACAPGEYHDLPLIMLGLALRDRGWRISFLGQDMPADSVVDAARRLAPTAVIVSASVPERLVGTVGLSPVARVSRLYLAGPGADEDVARALDATVLRDDPIGAAAALATSTVEQA